LRWSFDDPVSAEKFPNPPFRFTNPPLPSHSFFADSRFFNSSSKHVPDQETTYCDRDRAKPGTSTFQSSFPTFVDFTVLLAYTIHGTSFAVFNLARVQTPVLVDALGLSWPC